MTAGRLLIWEVRFQLHSHRTGQKSELLLRVDSCRSESGTGTSEYSTFKTNNHLRKTSGLGRKSGLPVSFRTFSRNVSNVEKTGHSLAHGLCPTSITGHSHIPQVLHFPTDRKRHSQSFSKGRECLYLSEVCNPLGLSHCMCQRNAGPIMSIWE